MRLTTLTIWILIIIPVMCHAESEIDLDLTLNNGGFTSYDLFRAEMVLTTQTGNHPGIRLYGVLDIAGVYYFWPEYRPDPSFTIMDLFPGEIRLTLLEFQFPDITDTVPAGPFYFWGGWYSDPDQYGYDGSEFWLDEAHKWTPVPTPVAPEFVTVPPGTFVMGSPDDELCRHPDEKQHTVTISRPFDIQTTEVTQDQWTAVMGGNPSQFKSPRRPVEMITWYDCLVYCNRLSAREGLVPCYYADSGLPQLFDGIPPVKSGPVYWYRSANGYRLPTESQWEYACRGGTSTAYSNGTENLFCSADDANLNAIAWYVFNSDTGAPLFHSIQPVQHDWIPDCQGCSTDF